MIVSPHKKIVYAGLKLCVQNGRNLTAALITPGVMILTILKLKDDNKANMCSVAVFVLDNIKLMWYYNIIIHHSMIGFRIESPYH